MKPKNILVKAVSDNFETGSATCVCLSLDKYAPVIYTVNLGDSGYLLLRKSGLDLQAIFRSQE